MYKVLWDYMSSLNWLLTLLTINYYVTTCLTFDFEYLSIKIECKNKYVSPNSSSIVLFVFLLIFMIILSLIFKILPQFFCFIYRFHRWLVIILNLIILFVLKVLFFFRFVSWIFFLKNYYISWFVKLIFITFVIKDFIF